MYNIAAFTVNASLVPWWWQYQGAVTFPEIVCSRCPTVQSGAENMFSAVQTLETHPLRAVRGTYTLIKKTHFYILLCAHNQRTKLMMHQYGFLHQICSHICQQYPINNSKKTKMKLQLYVSTCLECAQELTLHPQGKTLQERLSQFPRLLISYFVNWSLLLLTCMQAYWSFHSLWRIKIQHLKYSTHKSNQ